MIEATHAVLGLLSARWSVDVLYALAGGTRRYSELLYEVGEISKKTLTQTLRACSATGSSPAARTPTCRSRVEYSLTAARLEPDRPADGALRVGGRRARRRSPHRSLNTPTISGGP